MGMTAILGGTFDPLHDGHKSLFERAFGLAEFVQIGLTGDDMASSSRNQKITAFSIRKKRLGSYLYRTYPGRKFSVKEMESVFNLPIVKDIPDGYLVVSEGKANVAKQINDRRKRNKVKPFEIISVPYVLGEDGMPIKATRIRAGEINRHGKLLYPPVIAVGSTNKIKSEAVRTVFKRIFGSSIVKKYDVPSGVRNQPKNEETITGARNRALRAIKKSGMQKHATFGVGLEAGLFWVSDLKLYMDVQYAAVADRLGNITYGHSQGFYFPPEFDGHIEDGKEIEDIVAELYKIKNIGEKNGAIGFLTDNRVTRTDLLESALTMAMVPRLKRKYYRKL